MSAESQSPVTLRLACPNCEKAAVEAFKPFCSKRCADVDLGQWFNETYAIPAVEPPDDWSGQMDSLHAIERAQNEQDDQNERSEPWKH